MPKKKIMCLCTAPQGTLGDASAAVKLLESIQNKYLDEVEVHLFIKAAKENHKKIEGIIPEGMSSTKRRNY